MHLSDKPTSSSEKPSGDTNLFSNEPWWRALNGYHWFVLVMAALGWLFDTMDQQLFVLVRTPALGELLATNDKTVLTVYGSWATTIFIVGWATGGLIFGLFGDRWGRARTMMLTILMYSIFTGLSALSRSWWDFAAYRFLTGMGVGGEFAAGVSLVAEVMPAHARPYALGLLQALSAVGNMMAAGLSFLLPPQLEVNGVQGWRLLFLIGIIPALLVVLMFRKLREPDSWLRAKEAIVHGEKKDELHRQMGDLTELFRDPRWRYHTMIGVTLAAAGVMGLWGVGFWTPELVRNNVLSGMDSQWQDWYASWAMLLQNFGAFFGIYAFTRITALAGRRATFALSFLLGLGATVLVFGFMTRPSQIWWMTPLLGFCGLMVFGGFAIYFPELFPTRLRSTGTGFCYNVARYLAAAAPFMLGQLANWYLAPAGTERAAAKLSNLTWLSSLGSVDNSFRYATLTVALIYVIGLLILPFAPETKGKPLPE
ncbi:MAG TPA: MFS transporter [Gemmataceae bacterium]|jgi:MFS family permease